MNFLDFLLSTVSVAICTQIHPSLTAQSELKSSLVDGSISTHIVTTTGEKHIALQKLSMNGLMKFSIARPRTVEKDYSAGIIDFAKSPSAVFLSPSVPILDQGQYGTCVTFATTAAIDAVLGLADAISQQCSLELDEVLGSNLWNGGYYSSQVIDPIRQHGAVRQGKCGTYAYPNPMAQVSIDQYKSFVDPSIQVSKVSYAYHQGISVDVVKGALAAKHYVTIGFGLMNNSSPISVQGFDVIVDNKKKNGGLWACKQRSSSSSFCGSATAGHEVLIVGYDDSQHLFKIQNSWSAGAGDKGFFYMSYEFFSSMVMDGTEIY